MHQVLLTAAALFCATASSYGAEYKKPRMLIEAETLESHLAGDSELTARQLTIIDVRSLDEYQQAAIPGARHVAASEWKAAFGQGTDVAAWSERIGKVLRGPESTVVVYDNAFSPTAARIWWILKYWGVEDARVLNGGFVAWQAVGGEVAPPGGQSDSEPVDFQATPHPERLATFDEVTELAGEADGGACLVDARSSGEHTQGAIPTARHLNWEELVDPDTGKLRPAKQLEQLLGRIDFQRSQPLVTYCQSGGRSAVMAFVLELMGGETVANYYGSWGEWSERADP